MKHIFWAIAAVHIVVTLSNTFLHWKQTEARSESNTDKTEVEQDKNNDLSENEVQTNEKGKIES
jgi:hypothetical protein